MYYIGMFYTNFSKIIDISRVEIWIKKYVIIALKKIHIHELLLVSKKNNVTLLMKFENKFSILLKNCLSWNTPWRSKNNQMCLNKLQFEVFVYVGR